MHNPQLDKHGELQHLLTLEGLPKAMITRILDTAASFVGVSDREVKKVPLMRGKSVFNLFFEKSTETIQDIVLNLQSVSAWVIQTMEIKSYRKRQTGYG